VSQRSNAGRTTIIDANHLLTMEPLPLEGDREAAANNHLDLTTFTSDSRRAVFSGSRLMSSRMSSGPRSICAPGLFVSRACDRSSSVIHPSLPWMRLNRSPSCDRRAK
jgi:hypothetical protein